MTKTIAVTYLLSIFFMHHQVLLLHKDSWQKVNEKEVHFTDLAQCLKEKERVDKIDPLGAYDKVVSMCLPENPPSDEECIHVVKQGRRDPQACCFGSVTYTTQ